MWFNKPETIEIEAASLKKERQEESIETMIAAIVQMIVTAFCV